MGSGSASHAGIAHIALRRGACPTIEAATARFEGFNDRSVDPLTIWAAVS
jgi:hypothetical protein